MQYLVSVIDDTAGLATPDEMAAIDVFKDRLKASSSSSSTRATWRPAPTPIPYVTV